MTTAYLPPTDLSEPIGVGLLGFSFEKPFDANDHEYNQALAEGRIVRPTERNHR